MSFTEAIPYAVVIVVPWAFMFRIGRVDRYFSRLIRMTHEACIVDLRNGRPWKWRWKEYEKISFAKTMWMFWRPVEHHDISFTDPEVIRTNTMLTQHIENVANKEEN